MNWNYVTERLATGGGVQNASDADALIQAGITHVIDCRTTDDLPLKQYPEITYLWNPTEDDGKHDVIKEVWLRKSLQWALLLFPVYGTKLYCHCDAGHNRGPSTAYAIMLALGWDGLDAKVQIEARHPLAIGGIAYSDDAESVVKAGW